MLISFSFISIERQLLTCSERATASPKTVGILVFACCVPAPALTQSFSDGIFICAFEEEVVVRLGLVRFAIPLFVGSPPNLSLASSPLFFGEGTS